MSGEGPITEVPDVVGLSAADASEIVRAAGLVPMGPGETAPPASGIIIDQRPIGAAGAETGMAVHLWTSPGKSDDRSPSPLSEAGDLDPV